MKVILNIIENLEIIIRLLAIILATIFCVIVVFTNFFMLGLINDFLVLCEICEIIMGVMCISLLARMLLEEFNKVELAG